MASTTSSKQAPAFLTASSSDSPLSKGIPIVTRTIAVLILTLSVAGYFTPGLYDVLAMIPGSTLQGRRCVWNVFTGGYYEPHIIGAFCSSLGLVMGGSLVEPVWGKFEFLKFVIVVNFVACVVTFGLVYVCYWAAKNPDFLTAHVAGFKGLIGALTIGVWQLYLDRPRQMRIHPKFPFSLSTNYLPFAYLVVSFVEECIIERDPEEFPLTVSGVWVGWVYLRHIQQLRGFPTKGDPREEFAFANMFPFPLRLLVSPISALFHSVLTKCGLLDRVAAHALRDRPVPASSVSKTVPLGYNVRASRNSESANKRRERGYQLLELRLASLRTQEEGLGLAETDDSMAGAATASASSSALSSHDVTDFKNVEKSK